MSTIPLTPSQKYPWYGRKWRILVQDKSGNTIWDVSDSTYEDAPGQAALRIIFKVSKQVLAEYFWAEIEIWNFAGDTAVKVIKEAYKVSIEAGYKDGVYDKIFAGKVFQPMFERRGVVDNITTLNCIDGMDYLHGNFVNFSEVAGYKYLDIVAGMAQKANTPTQLGSVTNSLRTEKSPRGAVFFGDHRKVLRRLAKDNNSNWFLGDFGKLNLVNTSDAYSKTAIVVTPTTGLIGTPQQTEDGASFRCLLNPNIKIAQPYVVVKIDNTVIRQMKAQPNSGTLPSPLDKDGQYKVFGVTYSGDTRGNDWYVDVMGVNLEGKGSALDIAPSKGTN